MIEVETSYHKSLNNREFELPTDEAMENTYWHNIESLKKLKSVGIHQYEASSFSKPGHESIHNSGIGPGAHGSVSFNKRSASFYYQLCRTYDIMSPNSRMDKCELAKVEPMRLDEILEVLAFTRKDSISNLNLSLAARCESKFENVLNINQVQAFNRQEFLHYDSEFYHESLEITPKVLTVIDSILSIII